MLLFHLIFWLSHSNLGWPAHAGQQQSTLNFNVLHTSGEKKGSPQFILPCHHNSVSSFLCDKVLTCNWAQMSYKFLCIESQTCVIKWVMSYASLPPFPRHLSGKWGHTLRMQQWRWIEKLVWFDTDAYIWAESKCAPKKGGLAVKMWAISFRLHGLNLPSTAFLPSL